MNVGYVRLSRDEDKENYSSIESQVALIKDYAQMHKLVLDNIYIDDNCSGYTFNRPEFKKIRQLLDEGKIELILAKDLSRIGRHNAKVLLFIDEIKEMNKQLILIDEGSTGYDTNKDDDDIIGIKTWYNERYIKDVSHKIKSSFKVKQKNGNLIFHEFYGYKKDLTDKHKLNIDENIAGIIKLIFDLYLQGNGYRIIAQILNDKNILTPSAYLRQNIESKGKSFKNVVATHWETYMVSRILKNDVYIGTLRCGKTFKRTIKGKAIKNKEENQYIFENHHPAIISKENFELVQRMMQQRNDSQYRGVKKYPYIFSGYIKCGDCDSYMIGRLIKSGNNFLRGYDCGNFQKHGKTFCKYHGISEEHVVNSFIAYLKEERQFLIDYLNSLALKTKKDDIENVLTQLNKKLEQSKNELKITLNQKIADISKEPNQEYKKIIEETYITLEQNKKQDILLLTNRIKDLIEEKETKSNQKIKSLIDVYDDIIEKRNLTKKNLIHTLKNIKVYQDKTLTFNLINLIV
jgi:DNA invertase Pin-like site-specific DNA recombinase